MEGKKASRNGNTPKAKVAFLHPDLGLGGAERLIVDAAVGLQRRGYDVTIFTGYHNPDHAFPETTNGTLRVVPVGNWIPRSLFGRCVAVFAYLKMTLVAMYVNFLALSSSRRPQVIICDQVSACIPFLKLLPCFFYPKIMFYCHFPDQLLTTREGFLKKLYRAPIDWWEQWTTGLADKIVVNSSFTRNIFHSTFQRIRTVPDVLYPSINTKLFDDAAKNKQALRHLDTLSYKYMFVSVNRFEPKKNIALAIRTLKKLRTCVDDDEWENVHLVLAGGYDPRLEESVKYLEELKKICADEGVVDHVTFMLSPKDDIKVQLISKCFALLYTPSNEHFGIVPLEAMYMSKPVLAVDSGGPRETVVNEVTGFLNPANEIHFAVSMARLIKDPQLAEQMGRSGNARFREHFSFETFSLTWDRCIEELISTSTTFGYGRADLTGKMVREHID